MRYIGELLISLFLPAVSTGKTLIHSCSLSLPLTVVSPNRTYCYSHKTATLPATSGWVASVTTEETSCGSTDTPWLLRTKPGQTVNFTLYDFALKSALYNDSTKLLTVSSHCHVYAIFKEKISGRTKTICGGNVRVSSAYETSSNEVEVRIMGGSAARYFVLKYDGE